MFHDELKKISQCEFTSADKSCRVGMMVLQITSLPIVHAEVKITDTLSFICAELKHVVGNRICSLQTVL